MGGFGDDFVVSCLSFFFWGYAWLGNGGAVPACLFGRVDQSRIFGRTMSAALRIRAVSFIFAFGTGHADFVREFCGEPASADFGHGACHHSVDQAGLKLRNLPDSAF